MSEEESRKFLEALDRPIDAAPVTGDDLLRWIRPLVPEGWALVPAHRGYANLGAGGYLITSTLPGHEAELIVLVATQEQAAKHRVGDIVQCEGNPIPADEIAIRIRFQSADGLAALERALCILRADHFGSPPEAQG